MKKRLLCLFLAWVCLVSALPLPAFAVSPGEEEEEFLNITISGTQDYDQVLEMHRIINQARENNNLPPLTLDPLLTENAMQRAAEVLIYPSSTRPNGYHYLSGIDIRYDILGFKGHSYSISSLNPAYVASRWLVGDMLLSSTYTTIGIGCFYQDEEKVGWALYVTDKTIYDQFDKSGQQYVRNIPIEILPENLNLNVPDFDTSTGIRIYPGQSVSLQPKAGMAVLDGGYSLSIADDTIAQLDPETNTVTGLLSGTTSLEFRVGDTEGITIPVCVKENLQLNFGHIEPDDYILIWNDPYEEAYLFGKNANSDQWEYFCSPQSGSAMYTHYNVPVGEEWSFVLRAQVDSDSYIDISNQLLLVKLATPELSITYDAITGRNKLTWEAHPDYTHYEIYRGTNADGPWPLLTSTTKTSYIDTDTEEGQTYYYRICAFGKGQSRSPFSNLVSRTYSTTVPQLTLTNVASTGKPRLTWDPVPGAVSYEIYRATSETGTYRRLYSTTGTSLTNTSATVGQTYYYKVRSVFGNGTKSDFSRIHACTCDLPQPTMTLGNDASTGKPRVSWEKIDGAVRYEVYRSLDNEQWRHIYTTTADSFVHKDATTCMLYYYKIRAVASNSEASSAFSSVKSRRCDLTQPAIRSLTIIASTGKIKVKWDAVEYAKKYELYCSTDNKNWTKLITTTGTTVNHNSAVAGTLYYYKVRAIAHLSSANSAYSPVKSGTCDLARPTLTLTLNSSGKPYLSWTKITGAVKYEVYRSTDNQTWTKLSTTTSTRLANISAVSGRTYYYKVRAIASVSKANSAYSTVKSITAG